MGSTTSYSLSYRNTIPLQMAAKALLGQMVETTVLMIPKIDNNVSMASTVTPFYKIKKKTTSQMFIELFEGIFAL